MIGHMKSFAIAATGALLVMGSLNAAEPPPLTQATKATVPTQPTEAAKLYASNCQACHGPDGKSPMKEMAFVGREWKHGTKTADMIKVITNGVPGTVMMPFKGRLTEEQIRDLARYVRALDKKLPPEKTK
jgi:mono/diheme cytochrome c family protein